MFKIIVIVSALLFNKPATVTIVSNLQYTKEECSIALTSDPIKKDIQIILSYMVRQGYTDVTIVSIDCKVEKQNFE